MGKKQIPEIKEEKKQIDLVEDNTNDVTKLNQPEEEGVVNSDETDDAPVVTSTEDTDKPEEEIETDEVPEIAVPIPQGEPKPRHYESPIVEMKPTEQITRGRNGRDPKENVNRDSVNRVSHKFIG